MIFSSMNDHLFEGFFKSCSCLKPCQSIFSDKTFVGLGFHTVTDIICHFHNNICNKEYQKCQNSQFKDRTIIRNLKQPVQKQCA